MEVIFLLIIVSLAFIAILAGVLFWAIRSGQFDDLEGRGHEILMDDDNVKSNDENKSSS
jgi:cbb3-type cytochrome oxidase maturation protein